MLTLFSKAPPTPPPENADVIPCTGIDLAARRMVVTTGLIVDCKLDPNKLQTTLASLVEHKFPRAGARLAFRNQVWEFHVPHQFDETTPPIAFTSHDYAELYASSSRPHIEHIRRSSSLEPFVCDLPILDSFLRSPNCPKTTDGYLAPNTPLLQVHVSTFDDLTFLGVTSTHILLDAVGTGQLLRAWTRLLDGEALEDIPGMPRDLQPFEPLTLTTTNETNIPHMRGWYKLGLFSTCLFLVNFLWRLWREPKEEVKLVRVPKIFLERMKKEILDQLAAHASEEWVGSSDVMLAWWYKTSYNHRFDLTRLHVHLPVNLRDISFFSSPEFGDELKKSVHPIYQQRRCIHRSSTTPHLSVAQVPYFPHCPSFSTSYTCLSRRYLWDRGGHPLALFLSTSSSNAMPPWSRICYTVKLAHGPVI
ncbi:hypothetical protein MIND_00942400 [Mycena indigotica]|uniref:Uncharacterized protein n=1 Tax=Mycena indigotica TaxID=2126181 RepID=A0A8H6SCN2_9AGAR|nr:uncharacterized protein MIND_00942400 [Mycena indigotica]KAF7297095.1 hypothetical protein MIND_00942400 [Mycena indigotica]